MLSSRRGSREKPTASAVRPAALVLSILVFLCCPGDGFGQVSPQAQVRANQERLPVEARDPNDFLFGHVLSPYAEDVMELGRFSQGEPQERPASVIGPVLDESLFTDQRSSPELSLAFDAADEGFFLFEDETPPQWERSLFVLHQGGQLSGANLPAAFLGNPPLHLTTVATFDISGQQPAELQLFRIDPVTWKEMNGWEKVGYVTRQAAGVAGMLVFLAEIFE
jgi:hypothetical protein